MNPLKHLFVRHHPSAVVRVSRPTVRSLTPAHERPNSLPAQPPTEGKIHQQHSHDDACDVTCRMRLSYGQPETANISPGP